jgi:hypothetical protein
MAHSLGGFGRALRKLLDARKRPAPGSPADKEASGEELAGQWGDHPSRDVFATVLLTSWSCADHLAGSAALIGDRRVLASPYTLVRAAAESAALACYLSAPTIDALERVRRNMNCRLDGFCEELNMMRSFTVPQAQAQIAHCEGQIAAIRRGAHHHGFEFHRQDRWHHPAYIGEKPPSAMKLIDLCASRTPGLGATYQRLLSGVAHAKVHMLSRFLMGAKIPDPARPGNMLTPVNTSAGVIAQQLLVGPLCASTLVEHLRWFAGWDTDELDPLVTQMLHTWGRIARVPYTGPS